MKHVKKILALLLALTLVLALGATAFASGADPDPDPDPAVSDPSTAVGSITIQNATKGYEYKAYKVFDATFDGDKVSYKTPAANADLLDDTLFGWSTAADEDGNISVWALGDADEADIIDWVKDNYASFGGTAIDGVFDATNSTVTFSNLAFGYYYITSGLGTAVTIDSAIPDAEVYDKNETEPVDPEKTIVSVDGEEQSEVTEANAHVGSVVGFKVTAKTNNWINQDTIREEWEITDTPTRMEIDLSSVVVKFNDTELTLNDDYTAVIDDDTGALTINVPMVDDDGNSVFAANLSDVPGLIPIEITYSATITSDAGKNPAKNEIPGGGTDVYTYAFKVTKTDGTDPLPGAQFELWSAKGVENGEAAALTFIDNGDGTYTFSETAPTGGSLVTTLDMTENTTIAILGLDNRWSYVLKETKVPDGYNQAADKDIAGSELTKVEGELDLTDLETLNIHEETVINNAGAELPSTGGIGTTIFYVVGGLLALGAVVLLVTKKRAGAAN